MRESFLTHVVNTFLVAQFFAAIGFSAPLTSKKTDIPLFQNSSTLSFTLSVDDPDIATTFVLVDKADGNLEYDYLGSKYKMPVKVQQRGASRRGYDFKPLRIIRKHDNNKKHPQPLFENAKKSTKLVTPSKTLITMSKKDQTEINQSTIREHTAYQVMEAAGLVQFKTRLADFSYVNSKTKKEFNAGTTFFIEHKKDLAQRYNAKVKEPQKVDFKDLDLLETARFFLGQGLIGNPDYSFAKQRNIKFIKQKNGKLIPVAYDYDLSKFVEQPKRLSAWYREPSDMLDYLKFHFKDIYTEKEIAKAWITASQDLIDRKDVILKVLDNSEMDNTKRNKKSLEDYIDAVEKLKNDKVALNKSLKAPAMPLIIKAKPTYTSSIPLFQSEKTIKIDIQVDDSKVTTRDQHKGTNGTLIYKKEKISIAVEQRGETRLGLAFKPLKIARKKKAKAGSIFNNSKKPIKLVTQSDPQQDATDKQKREINGGVDKEYTAYKLLEAAGLYHFKVRKAEITYKKKDGTVFDSGHAFFIENKKDMALRYSARALNKSEKINLKKTDLLEAAKLYLGQRLINNYDYELKDLKNIKFIEKDGKLIPVSYDFDRSGIVTNHLPKVPDIKTTYSLFFDFFKKQGFTKEEINKTWITAIESILNKEKSIFLALDKENPSNRDKIKGYLERYFKGLKDHRKTIASKSKTTKKTVTEEHEVKHIKTIK